MSSTSNKPEIQVKAQKKPRAIAIPKAKGHNQIDYDIEEVDSEGK